MQSGGAHGQHPERAARDGDLEVSSKTGAGMKDWLQFVVSFTAKCVL
jgi:hypothetical protein